MIAALLASAALSATFAAPQDRAACAAQPALPWCSAPAAGRPATGADLEAVEAQARAGFKFRADPEELDAWTSYADRTGATWRGDCDDMTFTVLELLARQGVDPSTMRRAIVTVRGGADQGAHMVGVVDTPAGEMIVGDAAEGVRAPSSWTASHYRLVATSPIAGGARWIRSKP